MHWIAKRKKSNFILEFFRRTLFQENLLEDGKTLIFPEGIDLLNFDLSGRSNLGPTSALSAFFYLSFLVGAYTNCYSKRTFPVFPTISFSTESFRNEIVNISLGRPTSCGREVSVFAFALKTQILVTCKE